MKVCVVSSLLGPSGGGAGLAVDWLCEQYATLGIDVTAVTLPAREATERRSFRLLEARPWNFYSVYDKDTKPLWLRVLWQGVDFWNPHAFLALRDLLAEMRPDVVHIHKLRGFSPAIWHAARSNQTPVIVQTCQDYELMSPEGTLSAQIGQRPLHRHPFVRPYQRFRARWSRHVTAATAPSQYTLDTLRSFGFFRDVPGHVIPNSHGFNLKQLSRIRQSSAPQRETQVRFLYLGRLTETKGVTHLCRVAGQLRGSCRVDIAGWGPLKANLAERAVDSDRIYFHGPVSGNAKHQLLLQCDVLVVPSTWPEVFGIVSTEAFAFGKPVVASTAGGIPEVVQDGKTGFLFPAGSTPALREQLQAIVDDPTLIHGMRAACFQQAEEYATETVARAYLELYNRLLYKSSDL